MKYKICLLLLVVALLLSGCAIPKEVKRESENVIGVVVSTNYTPARIIPINCGKVITFINQPASYRVTVEYNGTTCDVTSGLTDADREWLATKEAAEMIVNGELYAVVKAMQTNDLGRLRHPYIVRLRNDL